jgi:cell division protein FtsX
LSSFHFQNSFPYLSQKKQLDTSLQHQNWYEIMPEIKQMLEADKWVWEIFLMILSVLLFLSFLGMNLLQIQQRKQEIQIFYFLGISKIKIFWLFCIEIFFYCILALLFTFMLVMPLLWYWQNNPIILTGIVAKSLIEIGLTPTLILQLNIENLILPLKICFILILLQIPFIYFYLKKQL